MFGISQLRSFSAFQRILRATIIVTLLLNLQEDLTLAFMGIWNFALFRIIPQPKNLVALFKIFGGFFILAITYILSILWLEHFVLPITKKEQRLPALFRVLLHGISRGRFHGPAVFVRNGVVEGDPTEFKKNNPGIAFLDLRSAMTLDKLHHREDEDLSKENRTPPQVRFSLVQSGAAYAAQVRTVGPGLAFIEKHEAITGSVDLRIQTRTRPNVVADTRDGIRVSTSVTAIFTVGQAPDILDVCLGGEKLDQVLNIEWEKKTEGQPKKIKRLVQELSDKDAEEVLKFIHNTPRPSSVASDCPPEGFPYTFYEKHVEQAVYSIANLNDGNLPRVKKWFDWPQDVAAEKFRILLSEYPYLSLYDPPKDKETPSPMKEFKRKIFTSVRNTGILAFRVVKQINSMPPVVGNTEDHLVFFPAQTFKTPDVLRVRGIKVINATIGELEPKDPKVMQQLRDSWLSAKKKEENLKTADYELEATRIINHARIRTQQNMNYHLAKLLEQQEYPREALAMLVYQELEAAAANPETRKLLPENTLNMMNTIGQLLMQSQKDVDGIGNERPFIPPESEE